MPSDSDSNPVLPVHTPECATHQCVMGATIMEIRDAVRDLRSEQKHIRKDVTDLCNDRRNLVWGILAFVGMTVGGVVVWALKSGANPA